MKITYLFGAGASKCCLPLVNEIPEGMEKIITLLEKEEYQLSDTETFEEIKLEKTKQEVQKVLIEDLKWLVRETRNHASIDTFAKKLFFKGKEREKELDKLQAAFSVYLTIEQIIEKPNKRYDSFFASILRGDFGYYRFPENLRILSWNYDSQFEISFSEYTGNNSLSSNRSSLNVVSKYSPKTPNNSKFALLKLNGSTNMYQENRFDFYYIDECLTSLSSHGLNLIIKNFAAIRFRKEELKLLSGLSFAWERYKTQEHEIVFYAQNETKDTEVLVVIGYSFPYFNREIDREIIGSMDSLKKVYFQAPNADKLSERFLSIRTDIKTLLPRFDLDQFLLPNEL